MGLKSFVLYLIPISLLIDWFVVFNLLPDFFTALFRLVHLIFALLYLLWIGRVSLKSVLFESVLIGSIFILYSLLSDRILWNLYQTVRVVYWIVVGIAVTTILRSNESVKSLLIQSIRLTMLIAGFFTIVLMIISEEHQNGSAYYLLWLSGLLLYLNPLKRIDYILLLLAIIAILMTVKRGAIISMTMMTLGGVYYLWNSVDRVSKYRIIMLGFIAFGFVSYVALITGSWEHLLERSQDAGGSGRDLLYAALISHYIEGNLLSVVFGYGVNSVQDYTLQFFNSKSEVGVQAHSDWLQLIHDFGMFGFLVMFAFIRRFWMAFVRCKSEEIHKRIASLILLILFATSTVYSFILTGPAALILSIYLTQTNWLSYDKGI